MEVKPKFEILYTEEVVEFLNSLDTKIRDKIIYNVDKSRYVLDKDLFKKLDNTDIWEFRTRYQNMSYRLFAFWDTSSCSIVIATHGFIKKTQKTPKKEIARAEEIRKQYFDTK